MYILDIDNATNYLLRVRSINKKSIIYNDLKLIDISRKNKIIKVSRENSPSYILKQSHVSDYSSMQTIRREAKFYSLIQNDHRFFYLQKIIPTFVKFDYKNNILTTKFLKHDTTLSYSDSMNNHVSFSFLLGNTLAYLHRFSRKLFNDRSLKFLPRSFPSILYISRPRPEIFVISSPASMALLKMMQQDEILSDLLSTIHDDWKIQTLIHGDTKLDNVIVTAKNKKNTYLKFIDWELVDIGDPAWDVGGILYNFLHRDYSTISSQINSKNIELVVKKTISLMKKDVQEFWGGYSTAVLPPILERTYFFQKSLKFCLSRLLQTAFDSLLMSREMSYYAIGMTEVAKNMSKNIDDITNQLMYTRVSR